MKIFSKIAARHAAIAALAFIAFPAAAATQGDPAAHSTGTISITATVAGRTLISGLSDLALSATSGTGDLAGTETLCIWTNTANRFYSVTASGSGPDGAFELAGAPGEALAYTAQWMTGAAPQDTALLSSGMPLLAQLPEGTAPQCAAGSGNAALSLNAPAQDIARSGTYAGQLTLLIAPE